MVKIIGILNVTPDSFSDGGQFIKPELAVARYQALVEAGADIVDIGAESTRPRAQSLLATEEWDRLEPVLRAIKLRKKSGQLSIDTRHPDIAGRAMMHGGVGIMNDVGGLQNPVMRTMLANIGCPLIFVMHSLSLPANPQVVWDAGIDPIARILEWREEIIALAAADRIPSERLVFDPGIGFGKTMEQNWALIERAGELVKSGGQWLYGHSRKSFLARVTDAPAAERDAATLEVSKRLVDAGVQYLRVHDVAGHVGVLCM